MKRETKNANQKIENGFYITGWCLFAILLCCAIWREQLPGILARYAMPCMFHTVTGFYCPGCGGTRAVFALLRGKLLQSFLYHPIVLYTVILGGWFMLSQTIERVSGRKRPWGMRFHEGYLWTALVIILAQCLIKNLALLLLQVKLLS
jgi:hypothetical protein